MLGLDMGTFGHELLEVSVALLRRRFMLLQEDCSMSDHMALSPREVGSRLLGWLQVHDGGTFLG